MDWLAKHPRFVFRFTPTSASWLNAVKGLFAKLTNQRLKRGVFQSLQQLKDAIHAFLEHTNTNPKPFTWTKDPKQNHRRRQTGAPSVRFDPLGRLLDHIRGLGLEAVHQKTIAVIVVADDLPQVLPGRQPPVPLQLERNGILRNTSGIGL
jgi:hypothetical protein